MMMTTWWLPMVTFPLSRTEQDLKEEQWERMQNPHLFGGTGGGGYRKVKVIYRTASSIEEKQAGLFSPFSAYHF